MLMWSTSLRGFSRMRPDVVTITVSAETTSEGSGMDLRVFSRATA